MSEKLHWEVNMGQNCNTKEKVGTVSVWVGYGRTNKR